MSRSRNIKPGFFKNEILVALPFEYRLLFVGLWTLADRAGRLEDRPVRIKMEVFPADNVDVNAGLQALHENGFVLRYEADGCKYLQILAWSKHQNPHVKEAPSTIPAPCEHCASTGQDTTKASASRADSLIPDSLIPDSRAEDAIASLSAAAKKPPAADLCPHVEIIAAYHEILPELPRVRSWEGDRQKLLRARWRSSPERQHIAWWREFFEYVRRCPFLLGQVQSGDRDPFLADLEWLIRPKNFRKVVEGKYESREAA